MRYLTTKGVVACLLILCGTVADARAQYGPASPGLPLSRPTVSPYLNLARPGLGGINYYNLVRPQFQFQADVQNLQQQLTSQQGALNQIEAEEGIPVTGHSATYLNYSHYYPGARNQNLLRQRSPSALGQQGAFRQQQQNPSSRGYQGSPPPRR